MQERIVPTWALKVDYVETCNCDFGCPCNFSGFPSNGFCRTLVGHHIREGNYGKVKLDGLDVVDAYSWPRAIHEGNGTHQIFITNNANQQEQKNAILDIFSGKANGSGYFALFASTVKYLLDPQFVDLHMNIDGRKSSFSVPGIIDVKLENFINPVTGAEQDTKIQLPKGFDKDAVNRDVKMHFLMIMVCAKNSVTNALLIQDMYVLEPSTHRAFMVAWYNM